MLLRSWALARVALVTTLVGTVLSGPRTLSPPEITGRQCSLGALEREVTLIRPRPHSFYSVDALNPDVVTYRDKYLMYFSGNSVQSTSRPDWETGLAVASDPRGPFRVDPHFRGRYLNGGTTVWRHRLWHLVEVRQGLVNMLAESSDGRTWHRVAQLPTFRLNGAEVAGADFYLSVRRGSLVAYMFLVHPYPLSSAFTLGRVLFDGRRWRDFEPVLERQGSLPYEAYDVGEPAVFRVGNETVMLYVATELSKVRTIAMAVLRHGSYVRCSGNPVILAGAPWAQKIAIDPSVLRAGRVTYVYYGGAPTVGLGSDLRGAIGVAEYKAPHR